MTYTGGHTKDCGYHLDQYESECTCGRKEFNVEMTDEKLTELLARMWIECDPNRQPCTGDELMPEMSGDLHNAPRWKWFVPRANATKEYLAKHGLKIVAA